MGGTRTLRSTPARVRHLKHELSQAFLGSSVPILTVPGHTGSGPAARSNTDLDQSFARMPKLGGFQL
jgi:hypothetical protein